MIVTSQESVRRDHQRVAMGTLLTYFSELVYLRFRAQLGRAKHATRRNK
jgi:hypothetical protein